MASLKPNQGRVAGTPRQLPRFRERETDLGRRVRVRIDQHWDTGGRGQCNELSCWIDFLCLFPQSSGIDLVGDLLFGQGGHRRFVVPAQIAAGPVAKFFWQIRVSDRIEQSAADALNKPLPVETPDLIDIAFIESPDEPWIVDVPPRSNIVDTAKEKIPIGFAGEFLDPWLETGDEIAFQSEADREPERARFRDELKVER